MFFVKMEKGKTLTDHERGKIEAFFFNKHYYCDKARKIKDCSQQFFKLKDNYGKKNTGGGLKTLSSRHERRVCRHASTEKYSKRKVKQTAGINVCQKTI